MPHTSGLKKKCYNENGWNQKKTNYNFSERKSVLSNFRFFFPTSTQPFIALMVTSATSYFTVTPGVSVSAITYSFHLPPPAFHLISCH